MGSHDPSAPDTHEGGAAHPMPVTVRQLAALSGMTVRTLHHYDDTQKHHLI